MFSAGLTYSARAEREDSTRQATRQARQARQVYACPAYSPCGFPLAQGQHGALVARETADAQVFTKGATSNVPHWPEVFRQSRTKDTTRQGTASIRVFSIRTLRFFLWLKVNTEPSLDCLYRIYRSYGFYVGMLTGW